MKGKQTLVKATPLKNPNSVNLEMTLALRGKPTPNKELSMKILLWNCRGARSADFRRNLRALIDLNNSTILALTETKMEDHGNLLQALEYTDVIQVPTLGYSERTTLFWKSLEITIEPFILTDQEIHSTIEVSSKTPKFFFSIIYAKNSNSFRKSLWNSLSNVANIINGPWLVCRDFNEVTNALEKLRGRPINNSKSSSFINCLDHMGMIDLGFTSQKYTWTNKHKNNKTIIMERLDRFLSNQDWLSLYPNSNVLHLPRTHLDHCPILLTCTKICAKASKIFRFETMWLRHPDFPNIVKAYWYHNNEYNITIEDFTKVVMNWNKQKTKVLNRLNGIQRMETKYKKPFHIDLENTLISNYNEILKREEDFWKLKSRIQWINDGDANTKFFHISTTNRRRRNRILGLNDSVGNWAFDHNIIRETILHHYQTIYSTELNQRTFSFPVPC
ncbi:hypothetical protein H5410_035560 [Solanum commersonii]|uniref:Endonuclease/exonuclease/phosphatase domain-containing protein n=1 Tax=Solanum commersonii TaxID=4109 RepID=A0A9J5Y436_SOLCO|nr:hypothetical protein H5410_035560 [Solanum commersonii]